jgi:hypothetical protein
MRVRKRLLCPGQARRVPPQFSWVDHRLIRENRLEGCAPEAWALYLFLVAVADAEGLSYYAEHTLQQRLELSEDRIRTARSQLLRAGLIAYEAPLYQVLGLEPTRTQPLAKARPSSCDGAAVSIAEVLGALMPACACTHADRGGAR